jgi:lipoate-protein ligase A
MGRFQCPTSEVEIDSCLERGTAIARRFTGGGATYHDRGNLNFSLSIQKNSWKITEPYNFFKTVGLAIVQSLKHLGLSTKYKKMGVYTSGRKLCGLAGCLARGVLFVHGSLLVSSNLETLRQVLNLNEDRPKTKFVQSTIAPVTNVSDELVGKTPVSRVEETLQATFQRKFESVFDMGELTMPEAQLAEELLAEKYCSPSWRLATCHVCFKKCADFSRLKDLTRTEYDLASQIRRVI